MSGSSHEALLGPVVDELVRQAAQQCGARWGGRIALPSREVVLRCVDGFRQAFFPGYFGDADLHEESAHYYVGATLDRVFRDLEEHPVNHGRRRSGNRAAAARERKYSQTRPRRPG